MRKSFKSLFAILLLISTFALTGCGNGTYYPSIDKMKTNLENSGYSVEIITEFEGKSGTYLEAKKDNDFIYFFQIENAEDCAFYYNCLEQICGVYFQMGILDPSLDLVKIENDKKFGNIVYCGTANAIKAAGIKVVKVDVKV